MVFIVQLLNYDSWNYFTSSGCIHLPQRFFQYNPVPRMWKLFNFRKNLGILKCTWTHTRTHRHTDIDSSLIEIYMIALFGFGRPKRVPNSAINSFSFSFQMHALTLVVTQECQRHLTSDHLSLSFGRLHHHHQRHSTLHVNSVQLKCFGRVFDFATIFEHFKVKFFPIVLHQKAFLLLL